ILASKSSVGDAQTLCRSSALRRDHRLPHERISDHALVPELQGVVERPVRPLHRTRQIPGILEDPPAELRELAGEPEHLDPVRAARGSPRPSANFWNVSIVGARLRILYSLKRPCVVLPMSAAIWIWVTPFAPRIVIMVLRSRRLHALSTSCRAKTRSTTSRIAG